MHPYATENRITGRLLLVETGRAVAVIGGISTFIAFICMMSGA